MLVHNKNNFNCMLKLDNSISKSNSHNSLCNEHDQNPEISQNFCSTSSLTSSQIETRWYPDFYNLGHIFPFLKTHLYTNKQL